MQPVIEMEHVSVASMRAPQTPVIRDVDWLVGPGEFWAIGGLPGSGKSDLMLTAAGLLAPVNGNHRLFGEPMQELSEEDLVRVRLRAGLVFSNEGRLFTHLTVAENLALPYCYHHNCTPSGARERVRTLLVLTELDAVANQLPAQIPRNLRERVALARALILAPELLLLDDPIRGMDPRQVRWWLRFLVGLRKGNDYGKPITLVVATDDLRPWAELAGQFGLIIEGRWIVIGDKQQLAEHKEPLLHELLIDSAGWHE